MSSRDLIGLDTVIGAFYATTAYVAPAPAPTYVAPKTAYVAPAPAPAVALTPVAPAPTKTATVMPPPPLSPLSPSTAAATVLKPAPVITVKSTVPTSAPSLATTKSTVPTVAVDKLKAAKARRQNDAAQAAHKLNAAANKTKKSKRANKLRNIAKIVTQRAQVAGDPFSSILGELIGPDLTTLAMSDEEWFNYIANVDAVVICTDIANAADALVAQLNTAKLVDLASVGARIVVDCDDIIDNFDPDKNVGARVRTIAASASSWTAQAQAALTAPTTTAPVDPVQEPAGDTTDGGGGAPDGGGGGAPDGGEEQTFEQVDAPDEAAPDESMPPVAQGLEFGGGGGSGSLNEDGGEGGGETEETVEETAPGYVDEATVKAVQEALIAKGYDLGETAADGVYNEVTAFAVSQLQTAEGLAETGVIDDDVLAALGVPIPVPPAPPATEGDLFSAIVGELEGRKVIGTAVKVPVRITKKAVVPAKPSAFKNWLTKPMWTGSKVLIWHGTVGAGAAITLSGVLLAVLRRKR